MIVRCRLLLAAAVVFVAACAPSDSDRDADPRPQPPLPSGEPAPPSRIERSALEYGWEPVPLGAGGFVTGLTSVDSTASASLYARTDVGGAYRWDERRRRWTPLITADSVDGALGPGDSSVASLVATPGEDGDVLYAAVGADFDPSAPERLPRTGRILRSIDSGATWAPTSQRWFVNGNQEFRTATERLAVDPSDPDIVYFGTQREGLWRSLDGGDTWTQITLRAVPAGLVDNGVGQQAGVSLVATVATPTGNLVVVGVTGVGVLLSDDEGESWERVADLAGTEVPTGPAVSGAFLLVATATTDGSAGRLLRVPISRNAGDAPADVAEVSLPAQAARWNVAADPDDGERLVLTDDAVRDGHFWTSIDGGATWQARQIAVESPEIPWLERTDLDDYMSAGRLMFDPAVAGRVWFAEGMGVWRTDDISADPVTWTSVSVGMELTVASGLTVLPDGQVVVTVADRQGFRIDPEGGYPSEPLVDERFASGSSLDFSAGDPSVLAWVGAESNLGGNGYDVRGAVSSDGGATWSAMAGTDPEMYGGEVAVSATDSDVIVWLPSHPIDPQGFSSGSAGLYVSSDGGQSWQRHTVAGAPNSLHRLFWWFSRRALVADRVNGDFYLMSDEGRFFVGRDGGATWQEARHSPPCSDELDCHVYGQLVALPGEAGRLWASAGQAGLYSTTDAGRSEWQRIAGIEEVRAFSVGAPLRGDTPALYVYGRVSGDRTLALWRSGDLGESWQLIARYPAGIGTTVNVVTADPDVPGRIYVGFNGNGFVAGDET